MGKTTGIHTPAAKIECGREGIQARHAKILTLGGIFRCQIFLHRREPGVLEEHSPSIFRVTRFAAM